MPIIMDILLVRHAKSAHDHTRWKTDDVRPLAPIGIERQEKTSVGMKTSGIVFDTVWVSPFRRAKETLQIILDTYDVSIDPRIVDDLKVWGNPSDVISLLDEHYESNPDAKLLLVGHNPNMSDLVELLTGESIYMKTSDLVHIRKSDDHYELVRYFPRNDLMR